jgi:hypothetical protein
MLYDKVNKRMLDNYNEIYFDMNKVNDISRVSLDLYIALI